MRRQVDLPTFEPEPLGPNFPRAALDFYSIHSLKDARPLSYIGLKDSIFIDVEDFKSKTYLIL